MYKLTLTDADLSAIAFVGHRYGWSQALSGLSEGENVIPEWQAWEIAEACESDAEGGHDYFPMLDPRSELAEKLTAFLSSIV